MPDDIKRVTVRIGGTSYQLVSAEDEQYTRRIAARADEMIRRVMQNNPQLSQSMATVLALINTLDDLSHVYNKLEKIEQSRKDNDNQAAEARSELKRMRELNWEMKKELLELRERCREAEARQTRETGGPAGPETAEPAENSKQPGGQIPEESEQVPDGADTENRQESEEAPEADTANYTQTNLDDYIKDSGWSARPERRQQDEGENS